jgi:hypothetical protein
MEGAHVLKPSDTLRCHAPAGCLVVFCLTAPTPAPADDEGPRFLADLSIEIEDEYVFRSTDKQAELNDLYGKVEADLALLFPGGSGLRATAVFEPVIDPVDDRYFEDYGLYLEELYLAVPAGAAKLRIGKFNPVFGAASDLAPGLYGDELAGDYELTERLGIELGIPFRALGGEHGISASAFLADRTPLSDSLFESRGPLRRDDGGVSNTGGPESFAVALAGGIGATGYNLGLRYQTAGDEEETDEYGAVLGLTHSFEAGPFEPTLFGEVAWFPDYDGERARAGYLSLGAEIGLGDLSLSGVYGLRDIEHAPIDRLTTVSLEYALSEAFTIGGGYRYLRAEGERQHVVGLLLTCEFSVGGEH